MERKQGKKGGGTRWWCRHELASFPTGDYMNENRNPKQTNGLGSGKPTIPGSRKQGCKSRASQLAQKDKRLSDYKSENRHPPGRSPHPADAASNAAPRPEYLFSLDKSYDRLCLVCFFLCRHQEAIAVVDTKGGRATNSIQLSSASPFV